MKHSILIAIFFIANQMGFTQNFTGSFELKISQESSSGNKHSDSVSYFFGKDKTAIIIHAGGNQPDLRLVFSPADSTITGLFEMNGKKGGYILPMNNKYWPTMKYASGEKDVLSNSEVNYTENRKEINGYSTQEIFCGNEEIDATFWVAKEIELSLTQVMAYQFVGAGKDGEEIETLANCGIKGLALYTTLFDKKRNGSIILQIENLSKKIDAEVFNTEGHELSDMRKSK
ncbi:hypothetical protein POV26_05565 [Aequorivita todarodis]|uniref:hypothetical protein n=1 Tax=Aequorivita todarodis TaxID=2036821 RepID=UPI0023503D99|nr:hypothetical protein [Aequorivita todarodis]MDC8000493.1 hypothetical protein [Aequorivita todarodis]